jgi:hypothetical protein
MRMQFSLLASLSLMLCASLALAQHYPMLDKVADKVVHKYKGSSCEQLGQERAASQGKPKPPEEQHLVQFLREDAGARAEFFRRVSDPIVTKMFECGMIP